jgi:molecular chaperone GrpE (heat shock protein)
MIPLTITTAGIFFAIGASKSAVHVPSIAVVDAFAPIAASGKRHQNAIFPSSTPFIVSFPIHMSGDEENSSSSEADSTANTTVDDSTVATDDADADAAAAGKGKKSKKEDKLVKELKESIASLESSLKAKKLQLSNLKDTADKYSSAGYARQVALVENNKRMRGANVADNKSASRSVVLQSFLPVLDELETLGQQYESNNFAKTLNSGLRSELDKALNELGVTEYMVESGMTMGTAVGRVVAVEEEYSEEYAKGTVIRPLKSGLEIKGNVIRPAEVVGSLGKQSADEPVAAEDDGNDGGDAGEVLSE